MNVSQMQDIILLQNGPIDYFDSLCHITTLKEEDFYQNSNDAISLMKVLPIFNFANIKISLLSDF